MRIGLGQIRGAEDLATADEAVSFHSLDMQVDAAYETEYRLDFRERSARNFALVSMRDGVPSLALSLNADVACENRILVDNSVNGRDVDVYVNELLYQGSPVDKAVLPSDGVCAPAGKLVALTYTVLDAGAKIGIVECSHLLTE